MSQHIGDLEMAAAREALEGVAPEEFEERLHAVAAKFEVVDALSVLGADGVQMTPSVLTTHQQRNKSVIFAPPQPGADHSMKEYVYVLRECGVDPFETAPYVPMPCGELCVTASTFFRDATGQRRILVTHMALQIEHAPQVLTGPVKM